MSPLPSDILWPLAAALPIALLAAGLLTPLVIRLAHRMGWLAYPRADRWHARPTALMGGIALFLAVALGLAVSFWAVPFGGVPYGGVPYGAGMELPLSELLLSELWPVAAGATLMFGVGLADDLARLRPTAKLVAQILATGLLVSAGHAFGAGWPLWLSLPLTLLWVVGITNALNLLDNMDGLAAGVAAIAALVMGVFGALTGSAATVGLGGALAGASIGFLWFNFSPARVFMGDCGSLFLGFGVASLALLIQPQVEGAGALAVGLVPIAVLAVPILDTTLVTFMRRLTGRPVAEGGRDHTSHRLVFLGLSERGAVGMLYGLSLGAGTLALVLLFADVMLFYALSVFLGATLGILALFLARANVYRQEGGGDGAPVALRNASSRPLRVLHALFGSRWKVVVGLAADMLLVAAAYVLAHALHYEGGLTAVQETRLLESLLLVVAAKVAIFYAAGLYRGVWRHAGTPELVRTIGGVLLGTIATGAVVAGLYGLPSVSTALLTIDGMAVLLAVGGVRFGMRGLRQYFAARRSRGRRVLLYGAGAAGMLTLRELRRNPELGRRAVAFVDDDPLKQGQEVQGVPVVGSGDDLLEVCREREVEEVILTTSALPRSRRRAAAQACEQLGISCTAFEMGFEELRPRRFEGGDTPPVEAPEIVAE